MSNTDQECRLSRQLYRTPTHFILEMIQNAEDNTYPDRVDPSLKFALNDEGYLWIACNEIGLTKENVDALCRIGQSTKTIVNRLKGFIGEKGIGFKSVFKVADVVWVKSGAFEFQFDRNRRLGMIIPELCDLPGPSPVPSTTMFCLHIPESKDRANIKSTLLTLTAEVLLFLEKLARIEIKIYSSARRECTPSYHRILTRQYLAEGSPNEGRCTLSRVEHAPAAATSTEEIYVTKVSVDDMPRESEREGVSSTVVKLGFPLSDRGPRSVYNFLPVRNYGFQFLLNADFILTADRGSLAEDNDWNDALIGAAVNGFVDAVQACNESGVCKYTWPRLLSSSGNEAWGTIMQDFIPRIIHRLSDKRILENQSNGYGSPKSLVILRKHFTDGRAPPKPLFGGPAYCRNYASSRYGSKELRRLDLAYESNQDFKRKLQRMSEIQLRCKDPHWHRQLAAAISKIGARVFHDVRIIPLRDGSWIAAESGAVYFPDSAERTDVPAGIAINIIDEAACNDDARKQLFHSLGARVLSVAECCDLIVSTQESWSVRRSLNISTLVAHAWYLHLHGRQTRGYDTIKFCSQQGQTLNGHQLYLEDGDASFPLKDYVNEGNAPIKFLHSAFLKKDLPVAQRRSWYLWLQRHAGLRTLPKLADGEGHSLRLSQDFEYLVRRHPSRVWLTLLKDHWPHYSSDAIAISSSLKELPVHCKGGKQGKLANAYLEAGSILQEPLGMEHALLIDVKNPSHREWQNLVHLGLRTSTDLPFFVQALRGLSQSGAKPTLSSVMRLYQGVEACFEQDISLARHTFSQDAIVWLPPEHPDSNTRPSGWLKASQCRWQAPSCLLNFAVLDPHFREVRTLFVTKLGVTQAKASDILDALLRLPTHERSPGRVKELLLALSRHSNLANSQLAERFSRLRTGRYIPVRLRGDKVLKRAVDDDWFIVDRPRLEACFEGLIWILDFNAEQKHSLAPVFAELKLSARSLAQHVHEETVSSGTPVYNDELSRALRKKAEFMVKLLPSSASESALAKFRTIKIWSSPDLLLCRSVDLQGRRMFGEEEGGRVQMKETDGLHLFFSAQDIDSGDLPWSFACDKFLEAFGLSNDQQGLLLTILTTSRYDVIEDMLERKGYLADVSISSVTTIYACNDEATGTLADAVDENGTYRMPLTSERSPSPAISSSVQCTTPTGRSPRPSNTRLAPSSSSPRPVSGNLLVPEDDIISAAQSWYPDNVGIFTSANDGNPRSASDVVRRALFSSPSFKRSSPSHLQPAWDDQAGSQDPFDVTALADALPKPTASSRASRSAAQVGDSIEHEIGYRGELFVFHVLKREVGISDNCWSSNMRSRHGLPRFSAREGDYSDLTIAEPETALRFATWLVAKGCERASDWTTPGNRAMTFHLEVKATTGHALEPFMMSNNQMALARMWHVGTGHIYIILRVYHLNGQPFFNIYVDPYAMMTTGELLFTAEGGYLVRGTRSLSQAQS